MTWKYNDDGKVVGRNGVMIVVKVMMWLLP
jgi:hypothetical protein